MKITATVKRADPETLAPHAIGSFVFEHGQLRIHRSIMKHNSFEYVVENPVRDMETFEFINRDSDSERWIRALALNYVGSRLWVEITEEP